MNLRNLYKIKLLEDFSHEDILYGDKKKSKNKSKCFPSKEIISNPTKIVQSLKKFINTLCCFKDKDSDLVGY
jgi:hypothetical protein